MNSGVVFVSYASRDRPTARAICEALEAHGAKCWIAYRDIRPGDQYAAAIVDGINLAHTMVVVLSEYAVKSPHISREVERACSKKRTIIVFRVDSAALSLALEYFLSECHWLDARTIGIEPALAALVEAIQPNAKSAVPEGEIPLRQDLDHRRPTGILHALWTNLDPKLQDAFSLAYEMKLGEGSQRISTRDFIAALWQTDDAAIGQLFSAFPADALPRPPTATFRSAHDIVAEQALLSDCIDESLHRFGSLVHPPRKLAPADIFVDVAKHGHGGSVARLRRHGIDSKKIDATVRKLGLEIIRPVNAG